MQVDPVEGGTANNYVYTMRRVGTGAWGLSYKAIKTLLNIVFFVCVPGGTDGMMRANCSIFNRKG